MVHDEMLGARDAPRAPRLLAGKRRLRDPLWLEWISDQALSPAARALRDVMRSRARRLPST